MTDPITWTNERRKLRDLIPWEINPAQIKAPEAKRLAESLAEFGQVMTLAISPDNEIYDGHQRQAVWAASEKYGPDYEVDVRVSSRALTEQERKKLVIYLRKGAVGEFDFDILANHFELDDLLEWGFEAFELGVKPDSEDWADAFEKLPDEDRAPFQQMTFTLHDDQAARVKDALALAKHCEGYDAESENENSNGNALVYIVDVFLSLPEYGNG